LYFDHLASGIVNTDHSIMRGCLRSGEIRILDSNGVVERVIPFDETDRRL
jgi:hypothetical protein